MNGALRPREAILNDFEELLHIGFPSALVQICSLTLTAMAAVSMSVLGRPGRGDRAARAFLSPQGNLTQWGWE